MSSLKREDLLAAIADANRKYSTSTILFHNTLADALRLNPTDHKIVDILNQHGLMTAGELSEITGLSTGSITTALDRLEKARFVKRVNDPNDRRKVLLQVIPDRFPEVGELFTDMLQAQDQLLSAYSDSELALILDYIEKTTQMMDAEAIRMRQKQKRQKAK